MKLIGYQVLCEKLKMDTYGHVNQFLSLVPVVNSSILSEGYVSAYGHSQGIRQ